MGHKWPSRPMGEQGDFVALAGFQALRRPAPAFHGRDKGS